jgi:hypothetical protein
MTTYEVNFFKHLVSDNGQAFRAKQQTINVCADSADQAATTAQQQFAFLRDIPDWRCHADCFEISEGPSPKALPPAPRGPVRDRRSSRNGRHDVRHRHPLVHR